jgi:hypothetical protein
MARFCWLPIGVVLAWSACRRIARMLLITLLVGFFVVRYVVRQFSRKELIHLPRTVSLGVRKK